MDNSGKVRVDAATGPTLCLDVCCVAQGKKLCAFVFVIRFPVAFCRVGHGDCGTDNGRGPEVSYHCSFAGFGIQMTLFLGENLVAHWRKQNGSSAIREMPNSRLRRLSRGCRMSARSGAIFCRLLFGKIPGNSPVVDRKCETSRRV